MAAAAAQAETLRNALRGDAACGGRMGTVRRPPSRTTSTPRLRSRSFTTSPVRVRSTSCGAGSTSSASGARRRGRRARGGARGSPSSGSRPGPAETTPRPIASATRSSRPAGSSVTPQARSSSCRRRDQGPRLRPQSRARGAPRPAGGARGLGRRAGGEPRSTGSTKGRRPQVKKERELTEAAGSPDHQGIVAWCAPYPYAEAWELAAQPAPLLCCLDQVTDPRNLGAVIRAAAGAGATGVILPAHGSVTVTAAVCRASAGAVEHLPVAVVPNLARWLADVKGPRALGVRGGRGRFDDDVGSRPHRRRRARARRRGQGRAAARAQDVRRDDLDPAPRRTSSRSTSRSRRRCVLYEAARQRRVT